MFSNKNGNKNKTIGSNIIVAEHLKCMYTNVRSFMNKNKREEMSILLLEKGVDVLGVTESWGNNNIDDSELGFEGYSMFRQDRIKGNKERGGGVLLYLRESLGAVREHSDDNISESLWVKLLDSNKREIYIGVCYRSPTASKEEIDSLFSCITNYSKYSTLIMGDFNYNDIEWEDLDSGREGLEFVNLVNDCFLTQHVKQPTRGANILDLVLTTEANMVDEIAIDSPLANSDHNILVWSFKCSSAIGEKNVKDYSYSRGNYKKIGEYLNKIDWEGEFSGKNVGEKWVIFRDKILECRDIYVPERKMHKRKYPAWMSNKIRKGIKKRNSAWAKYNKAPEYSKKAKYKLLRNKVSSMIKKAKIKFEEDISEHIKTDPKAFYSYVRSKQRTKEGIGPLLDDKGKLIDDKASIAEVLNKYFSTVFTKENLSNVPFAKVRTNCNQPDKLVELFNNIDITNIKVDKAVKSLKQNKAAGGDGLNSSYLLAVGEYIVEPLTLIYRESLSTGEIPEDWKKANITAIFKKGRKNNPGNYRPVSLTSHVGKIMEKIIKEEIVKHLENNNLITDSQHGFRSKKSCLTNLLEFSENIAGVLDNGDPIDVIYLDFQKAFDKVPHERLLLKLRAHGVVGKVWEWIKEWLSKRAQRVVVNGVQSDWTEVFSGVPQGSVLGPILFTIFINDLEDDVKSKIFKFADDTKLTGRVGDENQREIIKGDLGILSEWAKDWEMPFNIEKCKVMHMGNSNIETKYEMGGKELEVVMEEKDLGVIVCDKFKVSKQCLKAANKGNQVLGMIARTFGTRKKKLLISLYKSLVRPHLDYCIQAWRPHLKKDIEKMERVQRRATRMMEECRGKDYETRLKLSNLTTLETRAQRADMLEVYKIIHKIEGLNEEDFFVRDLRGGRGHSLKLFKKRVRLDVAKFSFGNRICTEWNHLPEAVVTAPSINVFKSRLDSYLDKTRGFK